jgi:dihydropteroate synthase
VPLSRCTLVGILNVTPDSFSDGSRYLGAEEAVSHGEALLRDGADVLDLGGDSTRPGSKCVELEEEWRRISAPLGQLAHRAAISVDTHRAEIARRALAAGASWINDINGGRSPEMLEVIAGSPSARYVLMHSICPVPHEYPGAGSASVDEILRFFETHLETTTSFGISPDRIILDPGMGAFLGPDPRASWKVLRSIQRIGSLGFPVLLGISRKGFLRNDTERHTADRDPASSLVGTLAALRSSAPIFLRVHNVALARQFLEIARAMHEEE